MGKGKGPKARKVKTVASKQSKKGAATTHNSVSVKHDRKAGTVSDVAPTAAPPAVGQDVAGAKVVGFTNLGNTCFFNSVLQVLVASPPLQHFFSMTNAKLHQGPLGGAMQEVFDQIHAGCAEPEGAVVSSKDEHKPSKAKKQKQRGCYAPQRLLTAVCKVAPHFKGFQQQDSHELLRVLLDGLQTEEAKSIAARLKYESPQKAEEEGDSALPKGFLSEVFGGQLSSRVACEVCHHTSVTLEPFMDLSLPIPAGTLADMEDSTPGRKGKKGKKPRKAEDGSSDASTSAVHDEAQHGTRLKPKQKKKLLKEERKASKLERRKQAKADSAAGPACQASAGKSDAAAPSSFASVCPAEATNGVIDIAQPSQTDCTRGKPAQDAEGPDSNVSAKDDVNAKDDRRRENLGDASGQFEAADCALKTQQNGQHQQLCINTDDVLQEFESLSPMLPDMPKHDKGDDLAGLFQAAFATCHKEMSPRGRPPQSPFSSHGQDHDKEDFSLYNDADEVMGDDEVEGTALDASDEEEEGKQGEVAGALLESFMGDAEHAAHIQASYTAQAEQEDEACTNIGNLFDESVTEAADSANFQDFGAADEADLTDEQAMTSGEAKLHSCLAEFFQQEQITWECPAEKKMKRELRRNSLGGESSPATPAYQKQPQQANGKREARRTVSFSEEKPVVTLIPGSVEQRGQVFRTSHGDPPFCRPLRLGAAFVLLTTTPDGRRPTRLHIKVQPQDDEEATLLLASNIRHLATADVPAPKVGDEEEEVRLAQAQVLMDCLADLLSQKGMEGTHAWCEKGLKLRCRGSGDSSNWIVIGQLPEEEGEGQWEYPSPTDPSQHPCNEMDLVPSQESSTPSSSSSSSQSKFFSTADRQDSANLDSMLDMISRQRHTEQTDSCQGTSSNTSQSQPGQLEPEQGSTTTAEAAPTAVETTQGSTAMGEAGNDTADSEAPQPQQNGMSRSGDNTDVGASTPPVHPPSKSASSPEGPAPQEAGSVPKSAEGGDSCAGPHASPAPPSPHDSQHPQEASATAPAAVVEGDKPPQACSSDQARTEGGTTDDVVSLTTSGVGSASSKSSTSGREQPQQAQQRNGMADGDGKAPKTPIRKAPKKGGLVNVQRPAVKGYSIHRCPPLLTVHVKRFQQDMRGRLSKIDGAVPFPINLNLTPFCDPKGPDANGAKYTLLGFVEHMGTMRSGHYVAYVQRGMDISQSPHLQALLHKHGLSADSALSSQASLDVSAAAGKKQKKESATRLAPAAPSASRGATSKPSGAADGEAAARQPAASSPAASTGAGADVDDEKSQASSTEHMNGKGDKQQSIPDDWESNGAKSATESELHSASGADNGSQPTDTFAAETDIATASGSAESLTASTDEPAVGQPTPPGKEPDTAQVGSRHGKAAAEDKKAAGQRSWFYISDTQVKTVLEADILIREAYIMLYMRTN